MKAATTVIALALLAACKPAPGPTAGAIAAAPPTSEEAARIIDTVEATFTGGDADAIMDHYAPGAVMFDITAPDPSTDRAIQTRWTEAFTAMKPSNYSPGDRQLQVLDADTIVSSGVGSSDIATAKGTDRLRVRYTDVYQKQADGRWKVVTEHLSLVPPGPVAG